MTTAIRPFCTRLAFCVLLLLPAVPASAQEGSAPVVPAPELKLPEAKDMKLQVPRAVRAIDAALGQGRQRLALVVGIARNGPRLAVDSAPRDVRALAAALRAGGFVVMLREDATAGELREALREFRERLQPGGLGFAYFTGLGAQVNGRNLLLARDTVLEGPGLEARLAAQTVPLQELVDALIGTADSPRLLVVDAAYRHPALAALSQPGLAEQRLPPGMMALFGLGLGALQDVPAAAPLPEPAPADPREIAASRFARVLAGTLIKPRITGAEALREARRVIFDATLGLAAPWVGGDTDNREEFAELKLLDAMLPTTPEEYAREGLKQALRAATRPSRVGEQAVGEVLQQMPPPASGSRSEAPPTSDAPRSTVPEAPNVPGSPALGSVASAAGTVAAVAGTAAAVAAGVKAAEAAAAVSVAGAAVSTTGTLAGQAVAMATRLGSGGASEEPARQARQQAADRKSVR
ncbi:exported hypothetical protein [Rubrivivax sp. A210]|uniref:caspase family protein n=1 Tax=Rubrivivax sp. A210 TaxID=2772301 RepID=UPI00191B2E17|nr:caspase family protein [Rubrivivax sp. A210]CAD5370091.1 exported hypothetical protein [Rubrivivax sp. A210]